jgi:hypothetical protein
VVALIALVVMMSSSVKAQVRRPIELGVDAALAVNFNDPTSVNVNVPNSILRAAFPIGRSVAFEPRVALSSSSGDGLSVLFARFETGLLFDLRRINDATSGWYVRPSVGIDYADVEVSAAAWARRWNEAADGRPAERSLRGWVPPWLC